MDKVWLVTGSASGLGRNIAEAVLESGDRLVATARNPRRLDDLVNKFGERVRAVSLDVADESAAQAAVQVALDAFGRLDVVVNNAGFGDIAPFEQLSAERFKAVIDTNFYGVVNVTRAAVPHMRKQRSGCILPDIIGRRPPDPTWQHTLPCCEMGRWGFYGISCPGTVPVRGEGLRP
jgi:NAD(P)-dependent dehydrogenase (short-subunit alcohol dehydrogenase family)